MANYTVDEVCKERSSQKSGNTCMEPDAKFCIFINKMSRTEYDKIQLLPFYKGVQPCKVVFLPFKFYLQLKQMNCALRLDYPNIS